MTFKEREKQLCDECHKYFEQQNRECSFRSRKLEDKCSHLQDIMYGWELGWQDTFKEIEKFVLDHKTNLGFSWQKELNELIKNLKE